MIECDKCKRNLSYNEIIRIGEYISCNACREEISTWCAEFHVSDF